MKVSYCPLKKKKQSFNQYYLLRCEYILNIRILLVPDLIVYILFNEVHDGMWPRTLSFSYNLPLTTLPSFQIKPFIITRLQLKNENCLHGSNTFPLSTHFPHIPLIHMIESWKDIYVLMKLYFSNKNLFGLLPFHKKFSWSSRWTVPHITSC